MPETFYEPRHQKIFAAIRNLNVDENPVDILTVTNELEKEGTLESVGGPTYIVDLASHVGSAANIQYHAKILQQKYMARQLISFASKIETSAFDPMVDTDELMQEAEGALFEISRKTCGKTTPRLTLWCVKPWTSYKRHRQTALVSPDCLPALPSSTT